MTEPKLSRRMSAEDAWFLYFERADAPLHIGSVAIYDGTVPFDKMYESMDARMHLIPRYRQRAIIPPFYAGHPTWEDDPQFSLDRHLRLMTLPAPGTMAQLREMSADIFKEMLPRDRPLWDITIIHGLEGDRTAMVSRVHHCLVDGVSGIELLLAVLDLVPNPEPTPAPATAWNPAPTPNPVQAWSDAMFEQWNSNVRAFNQWQSQLLDPRGQFRAMTEIGRAIEVALPQAFRRATPAPWNKPISSERKLAWAEMNFQEVRGIRSKLGGTVNDVVLTVLGGAFGRYLKERGQRLGPDARLRFMIPVNVRNESEQGALGNRVSMMLPEVPVGIPNPADRLVAVRAEMEKLKSDNQANAFESLRRMSENTPAVVHALAGMAGIPGGTINLVCTNVPGPLIPLYCVGHRMLAHYPMVPLTSDLGVGVGITSYDKALYLGVLSDPKSIGDDVDLIKQYIDEEFTMLRTIAEVPVSDLPDFRAPRSNGANGHGANGAAAERPAPAPEQQVATAG